MMKVQKETDIPSELCRETAAKAQGAVNVPDTTLKASLPVIPEHSDPYQVRMSKQALVKLLPSSNIPYKDLDRAKKIV